MEQAIQAAEESPDLIQLRNDLQELISLTEGAFCVCVFTRCILRLLKCTVLVRLSDAGLVSLRGLFKKYPTLLSKKMSYSPVDLKL